MSILHSINSINQSSYIRRQKQGMKNTTKGVFSTILSFSDLGYCKSHSNIQVSGIRPALAEWRLFGLLLQKHCRRRLRANI